MIMSSSGAEGEQEQDIQQGAAPEAGPSSQFYGRTGPTPSSSKKVPTRLPLHIPPSSRLVTLTETEKAPRKLALEYGVCIPCREVVSRCDGHEHFTRACTQCRKRGTDCIWALSRKRWPACSIEPSERYNELPYGTEGLGTDTRGAYTSTSASEYEEQESDNPVRSSNSSGTRRPVEGENTDLTRISRIRFPQSDLEKKGPLYKQQVPSAGWNTVGKPDGKTSAVDTKGKGKARAVAQLEDEERVQAFPLRTLEHDPLLAESEGTQQFQAILSQLSNTASGLDYLASSNYTALLRSMFAEDSNDLARSLHWWEFSESAKAIRARWPDLRLMDKKEWRNMPFLDMLLAENAHSWVLWPRPPRKRNANNGTTDTIYPPAALDDNRFIPSLPEAIMSTSLTVLNKSSLPDDIIKSMTPMHIRAWTQMKRDYGFPANIRTRTQWRSSVFGRSKFAVAPSSGSALAARYLDRDELVLDIVEELGPSTVAAVQHGIESVLLKIASLREKTGIRKPPREKKHNFDGLKKGKRRRADSQPNDSSIAMPGTQDSSDKGKEKAQDQDVQNDIVQASLRVRLVGSGVQAETAGDSDIEPDANQAEVGIVHDGRRKRKAKVRQEPADWQKILLAAIMVPDLPRSAIEATVNRMQAMYGQSPIDFLARYDTLYAPVEVPTDTSAKAFSQMPLPPLPRKKEARRSEKPQSQSAEEGEEEGEHNVVQYEDCNNSVMEQPKAMQTD